LSVLKQILIYYSEYEDDSYQVPIKQRHSEDAIIDHFRYKLAKAEKRNSFIPRTDFEKFLDAFRELSQAKPEAKVFSVLAEFQLGGGPRIGEACAVNFEDIDFQTGAVIISKTVLWSRKKGRPTYVSPLTKTDTSRVIYLTERALVSLREWKLQCGRSKGLAFSFDGFAPLPYRNVQYHYDSIFRRLHLKWRSTHILRHSYATDFLEKTGRKDALQGQLGHSSSKQTDHYAKITKNSIEAGVKAYDLSLRGPNVVEMFDEKNKEGLGKAGQNKKPSEVR
jgi:integrase